MLGPYLKLRFPDSKPIASLEALLCRLCFGIWPSIFDEFYPSCATKRRGSCSQMTFQTERFRMLLEKAICNLQSNAMVVSNFEMKSW